MDPRAALFLLLTLCLGLFLAVPTRAGFFDGRNVVIIDGDTIAIGPERIRLLDVDMPETSRPRCDAELAAGLRAKERLAQLLRRGPAEIERHGQDRFGRTLARIGIMRVTPADTGDVGYILIREGHALRWRPGRQAWEERRQHWCKE
jgi:micrococcal nuclease